MLKIGWHWAEGDPDMLVHPGDEAFRVHYDRPCDTLTMSPALNTELERVILNRSGQRGRFWPQTAEEKRAIRIAEDQSSRS